MAEVKGKKEITFRKGDIFLVDSNRLGARIVKFLMTAPTVWQYIFRAFRGTNEEVNYFHAGVHMGDGRIIEQQWKVRESKGEKDGIIKILNSKQFVLWRKKGLSEDQCDKICYEAYKDRGRGYDLRLILGKTLTWLTGIKWFCRHIESWEKEICITRVAQWYFNAIGEEFGCSSYHEVTTHIVDKYCREKYKEWEVVLQKGPLEDHRENVKTKEKERLRGTPIVKTANYCLNCGKPLKRALGQIAYTCSIICRKVFRGGKRNKRLLKRLQSNRGGSLTV